MRTIPRWKWPKLDENLIGKLSDLVRYLNQNLGGLTTTVSSIAAELELGIFNPLRYGAVGGKGGTDDTQAFRNLLTDMTSLGGIIYIPPYNNFTINGNLDDLIASKRLVVFRGVNPLTSRGNHYPPQGSLSTLFLRDRTDYLYKHSAGAQLEAFAIEGVGIDGSNGTGVRTATAPGIVATNGNAFYLFSMLQSTVTDFGVAHAPLNGGVGRSQLDRALFDLDLAVFADISRCVLAVVPAGRLFFTDSGATTFRVSKTYMTTVREAYYHRNTTQAIYENNCVFESMGAVGAQYLSNVIHKDNHYENLGAGAFPTGLTPRSHGVAALAATLPGNIDTAINQLYGDLTLEGPFFNSLAGGGSLLAWLEALGVGTVAGNGGSVTLQLPKKATSADKLFKSTMAFGTPERGIAMDVTCNDTGGGSPAGAALNNASDIRKLTSGRVLMRMNDGSVLRGEVKNGSVRYPASPFVAAPTIWPNGDGGQQGDYAEISNPVEAGGAGSKYVKKGFICTASAAGAAGTWVEDRALTGN